MLGWYILTFGGFVWLWGLVWVIFSLLVPPCLVLLDMWYNSLMVAVFDIEELDEIESASEYRMALHRRLCAQEETLGAWGKMGWKSRKLLSDMRRAALGAPSGLRS